MIEGGTCLMLSNRSRSRWYLLVWKMVARRTWRIISFTTASSTSRLKSTGLVWITTPIWIITTICTTIIAAIIILAHIFKKNSCVFPFILLFFFWSLQIKLQIILNNRIFLWINPFFVFHCQKWTIPININLSWVDSP